jgi:hypothetical protein
MRYIISEENVYDTLEYRNLSKLEIVRLLNEGVTDGLVFTAGRIEGHSDILSKLQCILDPTNELKLNLDGILKSIHELIALRHEAHKVITYIYESDALKSFAYEKGDDDFSISELVRELYYKLKGYKQFLGTLQSDSSSNLEHKLKGVESERDRLKTALNEVRELLGKCYVELNSIEAITISPTNTDGLIKLLREVREMI